MYNLLKSKQLDQNAILQLLGEMKWAISQLKGLKSTRGPSKMKELSAMAKQMWNIKLDTINEIVPKGFGGEEEDMSGDESELESVFRIYRELLPPTDYIQEWMDLL
eukprot:g6342.t1